MATLSVRRFKTALAVCSLWLLATACNSGSNKPTAAAAGNELTGAGSTFVYPIMSRWISAFQQANPDVHINYQSIGSGGGIQQLKKGLVDFGASDAALSDEQLKDMPPLVQIPESAGPVCITYNLPSLQQPLKLSPATLAGIYLGTIKSWHDPAIAKDNPGVKLPSADVVVAHRSDGSGTTNIFTTYLDAVSPAWHGKVGKGLSVNWPVGLGGKGSEGVTGVVKQTEGGIGYVELTYAAQNNLPVAQIKNAAGKWVSPSPEAASAAIAAFKDRLSKDVRSDVVNPPASAPEAYPISGLTFLLIPKQPQDAARAQTLRKFVSYVLSEGQNISVDTHYSKLPPEIQQVNQQLLSQVSGAGSAPGER